MKDYKSIIRRITPIEASRLQFGADFDEYLAIDGVQTSDSPQYKAVGNSWHAASAEFVSSRAEIVLRETGTVSGGRSINYATTCSGVECQSIAVRDKAWSAKFFSEIEPFPCRVLAARYPGIPNLGDMTKVDGTKWRLDLFSGGTPCQSVSVAGKRHGMAEGSGTRSSLAFHWLRIANEAETPMMIWENVPGALSSNGGADFAWFVWRITEAGYSCAWRVLDGQWNFSYNCPRALPQRRKRIWLVAWRGNDWRQAVRVLFERSKYTGPVAPTRRTVEGEVILAKGEEGGANCLDLFGSIAPHFTAESRADLIPYSAMPSEGVAVNSVRAVQFLRDCGEVVYCGDMFASPTERTAAALHADMLDAIGAGSGVACGGKITLLRQAQWCGGLQLPWNVKTAPAEFDGTVSALSDVLQPWGDYLAPYVLSHRACVGILRRAAQRGKKLDDVLVDALNYQVGEWLSGSFDWVEAVKAARKAGGLDEDEPDEADDMDADLENAEDADE